LNHPQLAGRAFILETPIDSPGDDKRNVAALWKLLGRVVKATGEGMKPRPHSTKSKTRAKKSGAKAKKRTAPKRKKPANAKTDAAAKKLRKRGK
jgi:hypothetical protein